MSASTAAPRGIRNNNPGNVRWYGGNHWQGLADPPSDGVFCRFTEPAWGIRVIARLLLAYQDQHGLNTVRAIINAWAPPVENDTAAYVEHVCGALGVGPTDPIRMTEPETMRAMVAAIIEHENGQQPYDAATIDQGMRLAGVPV